VRVWTTEDGKEAIQIPGGGRVLGFSPDGKSLAAVQGNLLSLWDVAGGKLLWTVPSKLASDKDQALWFDFSPDGKRLAWNEGGKITLADSANGKSLMTITAEAGPLTFSPDSRRLALACQDGTALVWEVGGQ
jgi:WD40 repeat protein